MNCEQLPQELACANTSQESGDISAQSNLKGIY